ncbi:MAG TPA: acetyl ornithine aminotransferase family protein [Methanomassiliicoccales archaeon]|nr:acetyl ornithine aminotransferase family protein [Methanomassiliicoccales archaeon]
MSEEYKGISMKVGPPGPEAKKILERDKMYMATTNKVMPVVAKRGKGMYVEDVDGNVYLDFQSGIAVNNLGHCPPAVVKAVQEQVNTLIHFPGILLSQNLEGEVAKELSEIVPGNFTKKTYFSCQGCEAIETAIKVTRWYTGRPRTIAFEGAFHGKSMGAMSLTASRTAYRKGFFPEMPGVIHVPYAYCYRCPYKMTYPECDVYCIKRVDEEILQKYIPPEEIAAVFVEPIQGEGGYIVPPKQWHQELRKICDKYGILEVCDEVQSGFGRTGKWFAIEHFDVVPDVTCIAKGIASGLPMAATVFNEKFDIKQPGAQATTFGGNPVTCAASLATMKTIKEEKLLENAAKMGDYLLKRERELMAKYPIIGDVRGIGLMTAIEIVKDRKTKKIDPDTRNKIVNGALAQGLLILFCGPSSIRIIPALNVTKAQIDAAMEILEAQLKGVSAELGCACT